MKQRPTRTRSIYSGMMIHLGTLSSPVPPLSIPRFDRRHTDPWLMRVTVYSRVMFELARSSNSFSLCVFVSLSLWSPCPSGIVPPGASSNELLAWHVLECSTVGSLTRVFATSEDGHQSDRVAFRLVQDFGSCHWASVLENDVFLCGPGACVA